MSTQTHEIVLTQNELEALAHYLGALNAFKLKAVPQEYQEDLLKISLELLDIVNETR